MDDAREDLVDALIASPVGVCLLAALEGLQRDDLPWWDQPKDVDPVAVDRAAAWMASAAFGEVIALAVDRGERCAGAWMQDAPADVARAYRSAAERRPIAEALAARFGAELERPVDLDRQEWWMSAPRPETPWSPAFGDLTGGYDGGEFPYGGLWTTTAPPEQAHQAMVGAWEIWPEPISRWHLPVAGVPRVWEVHRPADWVRLVETFPRSAVRPHGSWSLPGPNQHPRDLRELLALPDQRAARGEVGSHLVPDWPAVATAYDAVHLSWAGHLTAEGLVSDLAGGGVAMLRFWFAERVLWLRDRFGEPTPMDGPVLPAEAWDGDGRLIQQTVDVRADLVRQQADRGVLRVLLGR